MNISQFCFILFNNLKIFGDIITLPKNIHGFLLLRTIRYPIIFSIITFVVLFFFQPVPSWSLPSVPRYDQQVLQMREGNVSGALQPAAKPDV